MASRDSSGSPRTPVSPVIPLTPQQKIIQKDLLKKGIPELIKWLDNVKEEAATSATIVQVKSPFNTSFLKINAVTGKYAFILKWCVENIPDYDFSGIPSSGGYKIPAKALKPQGAAQGSASTGVAKKDTSIEDWLNNPLQDESGNTIQVSLQHTSPYVKLYTKSFNYLYLLYNPSKSPLTKQIYQKIQERLPKLHTYMFKTDFNNDADEFKIYTYDHLMIKILSSLKISDKEEDDKFFITEYDIFEEIYIEIEKLLKVAKNKTATISGLISLLNINEIIYDYNYRIMEYISRIRFFDKKKLAIKSTGFNIELTYKNIEYDKIKIQLYFFIHTQRVSVLNRFIEKDMIDYHHTRLKTYNYIDEHDNYVKDVSRSIFYYDNNAAIIKFMKTAIFDISELYDEAKINIDEYLPITEEEIAPPHVYPKPPVQRSVILKYIMLKNKIKQTKAEIEEATGKTRTDLETELEEYNNKMGSYYIISACEAEIKEYEEKKKLHQNAIHKYERDLKKYKSDVLGKRSPYRKKSYSPKRELPFTPIEKRGYKSLSLPKKSSSNGSNGVSKCVNESDPITQEAFEDMTEKKLDNLTKIANTITTTDKKKKRFITCYDTVALYNYILECYNKGTVAFNIGMGRNIALTNDDKNQVKRKIRAFTTNKTLPQIVISDDVPSTDAQRNNKKVFGRLIDLFITNYIMNRNALVTGFHAIKLKIIIGGIDFFIFEKTFIKVPMLHGDSAREDAGEIPAISMIYIELLKKKMSGNLFVTNYFPYRRNIEYILKKPDTGDMFYSDATEEELIEAREAFIHALTLM